MTDPFFKFPSTPHLAWLGEKTPRDDKLLEPAERDDFLRRDLVVEEKVDGANVGFSFSPGGELRVQNRGQYIQPGDRGQFRRIHDWARQREDALLDALADHLILFGEWMYAVHSVRYNWLPDWFLVFDVYDRHARCFWSSDRRNALAQSLRLFSVPEVARGRFSHHDLAELACGPSALADGQREGIYLRVQQGGDLTHRAKIVNPTFVQQIAEHWSRRAMVVNELRSEYHASSK